jgi:hypothetical protein
MNKVLRLYTEIATHACSYIASMPCVLYTAEMLKLTTQLHWNDSIIAELSITYHETQLGQEINAHHAARDAEHESEHLPMVIKLGVKAGSC